MKPAIKSLTLWGVVVTVLGAALPIVRTELANMPPSEATRWAGLAISLVGAMLAAYGRVNAAQGIKGLMSTGRERKGGEE